MNRVVGALVAAVGLAVAAPVPASADSSCAAGYFCAWPGMNYTGSVHRQRGDCRFVPPASWLTGSWVNQRGSSLRVELENGSTVLYSVSSQPRFDWRRVRYAQPFNGQPSACPGG